VNGEWVTDYYQGVQKLVYSDCPFTIDH